MMRKIETLILACAAILLGQPASADDAARAFEVQAGGGIIVAPSYQGSKDYQVIGFPIIAPGGSSITGQGYGDIQFRGPEDLRYRLFNYSGFEAGPLVGWRFDRNEEDSSHLRGLGDVDGGVVLGGYAAYHFDILMPFISYAYQVSGDNTGGVLRFGTEARFQLMPAIAITATLGASYADSDYMTAFFSVSPGQSASSGLPEYNAEAGVEDVYFNLSTDIPFADRWSLKLFGQYALLVGDAADSPIVETENQWSGGLGLTYRFDFSH